MTYKTMLIKQLPLTIRPSNKSDVRSQFAALCYRVKGKKTEVLLVSSRGTGRWIVPKGWPISGLTPAASAAQEAWEEAGVVGTPIERCIGLYSFNKEMEQGPHLPCLALLYPVRVREVMDDFPEAGQRKRKWLSPKKAAGRVIEPELSRLLRDFDPRALT